MQRRDVETEGRGGLMEHSIRQASKHQYCVCAVWQSAADVAFPECRLLLTSPSLHRPHTVTVHTLSTCASPLPRSSDWPPMPSQGHSSSMRLLVRRSTKQPEGGPSNPQALGVLVAWSSSCFTACSRPSSASNNPAQDLISSLTIISHGIPQSSHPCGLWTAPRGPRGFQVLCAIVCCAMRCDVVRMRYDTIRYDAMRCDTRGMEWICQVAAEV